MPFFSVIIPTFNRADLLRSAVESVWRQTFTDFEIIVVDDGSTDSTPALLAEWGEKVKGIRQVNSGAGAARNRGIAAASGDYCAFLDSDDLWFPWTLESYRQAIQQTNEPAGLFATPFHFSEPREIISVAATPLQVNPYADFLDIADGKGDVYVSSNACAWKTSLLRQAGGFIEAKAFSEDIELFIRLGTEPRVVHIAAPPAVAVRRHAGGSLGNLDWYGRGTAMLVQRERAGLLPGGPARRPQRLAVITSHCVEISLWCLMQRRYALGLRIYSRILIWMLQRRRFKYVIGFPLTILFPKLNPLHKHIAQRTVNNPTPPIAVVRDAHVA